MAAMCQADSSQADAVHAEFADIVSADAEWVASEFAQIVAVLVTESTATATVPRPAGARGALPNRRTVPVVDLWVRALSERVRAPPRGAAAGGHPHHPLRPDGS
jgi:hypothetical protein